MSPFWRECYKSIFYTSIVLSIISVIIVSVNMIINGNTWGWLVMVFGVFFVIGSHALIGALLEMMYNIAALKEKFCGPCDVKINKEITKHEDEDECVDKRIVDDEEIGSEPDEHGFIPWTCPKCGTRNVGKNNLCRKCGHDIDATA